VTVLKICEAKRIRILFTIHHLINVSTIILWMYCMLVLSMHWKTSSCRSVVSYIKYFVWEVQIFHLEC